MRKHLPAVVMLFVCVTTVLTGQASELVMETVNDLFDIYNEAQLEDANALQREYMAMLDKLADVEKGIADVESYNILMDEAQRWQAEQKGRVSNEISTLAIHSQEIREQIGDEFYGDWDRLVQLDKAYSMNISKMNQLLKEYDRYTVTGKKVADYDALDELSAEIAELQKVYQTTATVKVLGKVHGVQYPLNKETLMTSGYGSRVDPITGAAVSFHSGIDLRAATGTEVLAVFNGVVMSTGYTATGGYYVNIDHGNGVRSFYCHLSEILCDEGQTVNQYDVVALSGNTGTRTTGPHLHFALYINGNSVNPETLYNAR